MTEIETYISKQLDEFYSVIETYLQSKSFYKAMIKPHNEVFDFHLRCEKDFIFLFDSIFDEYKKAFSNYMLGSYTRTDSVKELLNSLNKDKTIEGLIDYYNKCGIDNFKIKKTFFKSDLKAFINKCKIFDNGISKWFDILNNDHEEFQNFLKLYDQLIKMKERSLYDLWGNINWYIYENKFGKSKFEVRYEDTFFHVKNVDDLYKFIIPFCTDSMKEDVIYQYVEKT